MIVVVMGVSGSGKSTVGAALAARLGWPFVEADDLHSPENVAKMAAGIPLTDDDRWPWLDRVVAELVRVTAAEHHAVVACSALRQAYRDRVTAAGLASDEAARLEAALEAGLTAYTYLSDEPLATPGAQVSA